MKLIIINSYLNKFDSLRANPLKNISELQELRDEVYSVIKMYINKYNKEDDFTDILYHIALDVNFELEKALEELEHNQGVQL